MARLLWPRGIEGRSVFLDKVSMVATAENFRTIAGSSGNPTAYASTPALAVQYNYAFTQAGGGSAGSNLLTSMVYLVAQSGKAGISGGPAIMRQMIGEDLYVSRAKYHRPYLDITNSRC